MPIINTKKMQNPTYRSLFQHLREGKLEIPIIQRSYAWETEQIEDFYGDISQMLQYSSLDDIENNEINIAIGQGIFYINENTTYIYDGQQRILTYLLFCKAATKRLLDKYNETRDDKYKSKIESLKKAYTYERKTSLIELEEESRVIVQKKDRDALDYILEFSKTHKKTNSLLVPAFKLINAWISTVDDSDLDKLYDILTKKIEMLILVAKNDNDAEGLFYSTNSTGKPLSVSQLLHARVHQVYKESKNILKRWDDIYNKLNEREKKVEKIDSYLLYAVQVEEFVITSAQVFTYINKKIRDYITGKQYLETIISRLETLFSLIYDNNSEFVVINSIVAITAIKQIYPLFLALSESHNSDKEIAKYTIEILTYIILQNNIIRQSPGTTKHTLADIKDNIIAKKTDIFSGILKDANIFEKITDTNVSFDNKTGKALFILCALHNNGSNTSLTFNSRGTELEHIVPQDYDKWYKEYPCWKKEIDDNEANLIYSFGNFILLPSKINKQNSNKIWEDKGAVTGKKHELLKIGSINIFDSIFGDNLVQQDSITPSYIIERGKKIAKVLTEGIFAKFSK